MEVSKIFAPKPLKALTRNSGESCGSTVAGVPTPIFAPLLWSTFLLIFLAVRPLWAESSTLLVPGTKTGSKGESEIHYKIHRLNRQALFRGKFQFTTPDGLQLIARRRARTRENSTRTDSSEVETASSSGNLYEKSDSYFDHKVGEYYLTAGLGDHDALPALHLTFSNSDLDRTYTIKSDITRRHFTLVQVDETKRLNCSGAIHDDAVATPAAADLASSSVAGDNIVVDVLMLYSAEAYTAVGGATNMATEANNAIASANQGYTNSGMGLELRLAHVTQSTSSETGALGTDLNHLTTTNDGFFDEAPTLAATYYADVITVFTQTGDYCGIGYIGYGYNVVARGCISNYSFQHEVGHNFGSDHDIANGGSGLYAYSNGWRFTGNSAVQYRTVMAYSPGTRINYFSNPNISYDGVATGTSTANNALSHLTYAPTLAATRENPSGGGGSPGSGSPSTPATPTPTATPLPGEVAASIASTLINDGGKYFTATVMGSLGTALEGVSVDLYFKSAISRRYKKKLTFASSAAGSIVRLTKKGRYYFALTDDPSIKSSTARVR